MKRLFTGHAWRWRGRITVLALAGLGATGLVVGVGASDASRPAKASATPANPPAATAASPAAANKAAVFAYWTPARMASAKPAPGAVAGGSSVRAVNAGDTATGRPGVAGGYVPAGHPSLPGMTNRQHEPEELERAAG
ncbi:MAG TPA: hypothetical protein VGL78_17605 [Solirubrobacteraceae bacterium]|jgi:hypothetical protein